MPLRLVRSIMRERRWEWWFLYLPINPWYCMYDEATSNRFSKHTDTYTEWNHVVYNYRSSALSWHSRLISKSQWQKSSPYSPSANTSRYPVAVPDDFPAPRPEPISALAYTKDKCPVRFRYSSQYMCNCHNCHTSLRCQAPEYCLYHFFGTRVKIDSMSLRRVEEWSAY